MGAGFEPAEFIVIKCLPVASPHHIVPMLKHRNCSRQPKP